VNAAIDHATGAPERTEAAASGNSAGALASRCIVVTRPAAQSATLAAAIRDAGGEPLLFPTIEIRDATDVAALDAALSDLAGYDWAFFVSPNAVEKTFARAPAWPASIRVAAIGPGTRAALLTRGVPEVTVPEGHFDSEGLLALPQFAAMHGMRCVIFRGNGGRELIGATLTARGASVDLVECYRRAVPDRGAVDAADLLARWSRRGIDALTFTSSEGTRNFAALAGEQARAYYAATPAFVPHARIGETARRLGFSEVIETGPADAGLLSALCRRFGIRDSA
jgi:uroporphyrinogen-III synthase